MNDELWNTRIERVREYMKTDDFKKSEDWLDSQRIIEYGLSRVGKIAEDDIEGYRKRLWSSIMLELRHTNFSGCGCGTTPVAIVEIISNMIPKWRNFYNDSPKILLKRKGWKTNVTWHLFEDADEYVEYQSRLMRAKLVQLTRSNLIEITDEGHIKILQGEEE
jgi:hypothetical protein